MRTEDIRYITEIYRTRNISRAAEHLNISSQGLGKALRSFEDEIGCRLFERISTGVKPTSMCELIYSDLCGALSSSEKIIRTIADVKKAPSGTEFIVCKDSILSGMVKDALVKYNQLQNKNVIAVALPVPDDETEREFEEKKYQYRIATKELINNDIYKSYTIAKLHFHPLVGADSPLCRKTSISINDFKGYTLIVDSKARPFVTYYEKCCRDLGIESEIKEGFENIAIGRLLREHSDYIYFGQRADINNIVTAEGDGLMLLNMDPPFETSIVIQSRSGQMDPALLNAIRHKLAFFSDRYLD